MARCVCDIGGGGGGGGGVEEKKARTAITNAATGRMPKNHFLGGGRLVGGENFQGI